jgi:RNA polymerase sigma factor (sigma-70 family)
MEMTGISSSYGVPLPARSWEPNCVASAERAAVFDACYREHRDRVFGLCLRYGGGRPAWAEDVTHDVFMKLYVHLPALEKHDDLGSWLYRVAANIAISHLRREQSFIGKLRRAFAAESLAEAPIDEQLSERQSADRAVATLRTLPAKERVVLCMKILDGKSQREIAELLSLSEGYVSKLHAGVRQRKAADELPIPGLLTHGINHAVELGQLFATSRSSRVRWRWAKRSRTATLRPAMVR